MKRFGSLVGLVAFEIVVIVGLHRLGSNEWIQITWRALPEWLDSTPPEDALAAVIRVVALALAYWLAATTALYFVARLSRVPSAIRAVEWATLPAVRSAVDRVAAASLVAATVTSPIAPAVASEPEPVVYEVGEDGVPLPSLVPVPGAGEGTADPAPYVPTPAGTVPSHDATPDPAADTSFVAAAESTQYEVVEGDHFWNIAERVVAQAAGVDAASDGDVARYWMTLVDANRDTIRSGDPDLIYPGEVVVIPPYDE